MHLIDHLKSCLVKLCSGSNVRVILVLFNHFRLRYLEQPKYFWKTQTSWRQIGEIQLKFTVVTYPQKWLHCF